jgi:hypothetical protein
LDQFCEATGLLGLVECSNDLLENRCGRRRGVVEACVEFADILNVPDMQHVISRFRTRLNPGRLPKLVMSPFENEMGLSRAI